jgi:hypothetical protein
MALIVSLFFGFVPMFFFAAFVYWLDRYEKEPIILLGATFFWGVVIAAGGAFIINTAFGMGIYVFTGSEGAADVGTTSIVAPIVEEFLKGFAVLIVFFLFRKEFDSVLDGIIYAAILHLPQRLSRQRLERIIFTGFHSRDRRRLAASVLHSIHRHWAGSVAHEPKPDHKIHCAIHWLWCGSGNTCVSQHIWRSHWRTGRPRRRHLCGLDRLAVHVRLYHLDDQQRAQHPKE